MQVGQIARECLPGLRAVIAGLQGLQEQQRRSGSQDPRGLQVPGDAQRGQALGLEYPAGAPARVLPATRVPSS